MLFPTAFASFCFSLARRALKEVERRLETLVAAAVSESTLTLLGPRPQAYECVPSLHGRHYGLA